MRKVVMSVALSTNEDPNRMRAAQIAAQALHHWTGGSEAVQLLSARWEAEDDPLSGPGVLGRSSGV